MTKNDELIKEWLPYFKNIEKENDLIRLLIEYFINCVQAKLRTLLVKQFDEDYVSSSYDDFIEDLPTNINNIPTEDLRYYLDSIDSRLYNIQDENIKNICDDEYQEIMSNYDKYKAMLYKLAEKMQKLKPSVNNTSFSSFSLCNFKGFSDENDIKDNTIDIKPITLIYGPNSYGKSSILQSLLLLHQTVKEGEDFNTINLLPTGKNVRLGTFKDFINKKDINKTLKFEFSFPFNTYYRHENYRYEFPVHPSFLTKLYFDFNFTLNNEQIILSKIDVFVESLDFSDTQKIKENKKELFYTIIKKFDNINTQNNNIKKNNKETIIEIDNEQIILPQIDGLKEYIDINDTKKVLKDNVYELLKYNNKIFQITRDELEKISFFSFSGFVPKDLFSQIEAILKNIVYVSSYRTAPERFYVPENNRRDYVGKNGQYTSEILSYDTEVRKKVNEWLEKIAGYKISSKKKNGDYKSINLNDSTTEVKDINLIDLGSGIAQVLPIITQSFKSKEDMVLIEEPEIHLHPKAQAELGSMFADAIKTTKNTFVIETHSENLFLRLGKLIRKGELTKDDVSIIYVHKDKNGSHCIPLILNNEGGIENINEVPGGFFDEGFNELFLS